MAGAILVVDDDECTRELMYIHLSNAGYEVLLAEDAIVGGHFLLDRRVDLLITDIAMPYLRKPVRSGELLAAVRKHV
jgi:DNA-binding response OmpR family regulator